MKTVILLVIFNAIIGTYCVHGTYISIGIAKSMCSSLKTYAATNQLDLQIKRNTAGTSSSQGFIRWTKCDKPCSPFVKEEIKKASSQVGSDTHTISGGSAIKANEFEGSTKKLSIIVTFKDQQHCMLKEIPKSRSSDPQAVEVTSTMKSLQEHAQRTQKGVLDLLETKKRSKTFAYDKIEKLWIINAISISGASLSDVQAALEGHPDVLSVRMEQMLTIPGGPSGGSQVRQQTDYDSIIPFHWGVQKMGAPKVWAQGYNGSGIIVGQIDSGVDVSHEILKHNYRKDYGWYDPFEKTAKPRYPHFHGTHIIGTAVGRKGIGVAPGARFITCLGCLNETECSELALIACGQWLYCPTDTNGANPDCSKRPHVVNFSIGKAQKTIEDLVVPVVMALVDCWQSVGIIPVAAIGNDGPECESAGFPGVLNTVIAVGNLERLMAHNDGTKRRTKRRLKTIKKYCRTPPPSTTPGPTAPPTDTPQPQSTLRCHFSSSRGPPLSIFNGTTKPDVSAPGTQIASSIPNNQYELHTGTSTAAPHVTGMVALMLQKDPSLTFDKIKEILTSAAIQPEKVSEANSECGGISEAQFPNNCVGHGFVDAVKVMNRVTKKI